MRRLVVGTMIAVANHGATVRAGDEASSLDLGRAIYQQHCALCHGADAQGASHWQERDAHGELPAPPHNTEGHTWRHSDADLYQMVSKGWRDPFNKTQRLTMPAFGEQMSPEQIRAVIMYLKTLWTSEQRQFQLEESQGHPFPSEVR